MKYILRLNALKLETPARWSQKLPGSPSTPNVLGVKRKSFHFFSFYHFFKKSPLKLGNKDAISLSNCRTQFKGMSITENKLSQVPRGHYVCSVCNCFVFILIFQLLFYLFCGICLLVSGFFCPIVLVTQSTFSSNTNSLTPENKALWNRTPSILTFQYCIS